MDLRRELKRNVSPFTILLIVLSLFLIYDVFVGVNKIAVVILDGPIDREKAANVITALDTAEKDPFVKAVVIRINSPGGIADAVHEIYYKMLKVKSVKPIVASVDELAASGGYYVASQANYIFSKQSSDVGGIGVVAELPTDEEKGNLITTGPYKRGADVEEVYRVVDLLKQDFYQAVKFGRGEKLKLSAAELFSARLYSGYDALEYGLIDEIGGLEDAILKAQSLAHLSAYRVVYVATSETDIAPLFVNWNTLSSNTTTAPVYYYLVANAGGLQ